MGDINKKWTPVKEIEKPSTFPYSLNDLNNMKKGSAPFYVMAYSLCEIDKGFEGYVSKMADLVNKYKGRYEVVSLQTGVPWWWVGCVHYKEASCDFSRCLHNGDLLPGPTVRVPANRGPFASWEVAAVDALQFDGISENRDWSIPGALALAERYNGLGYLKHHTDENTPYLWSQSNINDDFGIYVSDGKFSSSASANGSAGFAVVLKEMEKKGYVVTKD